MNTRLGVTVLLAVLLLGYATQSQAQVTTATFYGIVTDPSNATIGGATVSLTNEGTGAITTKTTDEAGEFVFNFLPVGFYTLKIEAPGFKRFESRGLELQAAQNVRSSYSLEVGEITQTVTVTGETPLVRIRWPLNNGKAFLLS